MMHVKNVLVGFGIVHLFKLCPHKSAIEAQSVASRTVVRISELILIQLWKADIDITNHSFINGLLYNIFEYFNMSTDMEEIVLISICFQK